MYQFCDLICVLILLNISFLEKLLRVLIFGVCRNISSDCVFAKYHYNFITHLLEHTVTTWSSIVLSVFEHTVCFSKDIIGRCVSIRK
jgi:hypothetical protein